MTREYKDQTICKIINEAEEQAELDNLNIAAGITVNDTFYEFQEASFFEERLKIHLPVSFVDMPPALVAIKYPLNDNPDVIKCDATGSVSLVMKRIENNICEEHIPEVTMGVKHILKTMNPAYFFFDEGTNTIAEKNVGFLAYKSFALDTALYNLMFFVEFDHDIIMSCFNFPHKDNYKPWQKAAMQIMQSVRVMPKAPEEETAVTQNITGGKRA